MPFLVYSLKDVASTNAAEALKKEFELEEDGEWEGLRIFRNKKLQMLELKEHHVHADYLDKLETDLIIMLSRHFSAQGVPCLTSHPTGNWGNEAKIGGKPKQLSTASPVAMAKVLVTLKKNNKTDIPVTYEATHHGPLLKTPLVYAELGGNEQTWLNKNYARLLSRSVVESMEDDELVFDKIAFGIGGLHYEDRFAKLAFEGKYAFGHMMSKHYVTETDMIGQAIERCSPKPEIAVIEWKSIKGEVRDRTLKKLEELGLDYVKI